jgi:glycosyltransferase involved in cell wall biosynthesis
MPLRVVLDARHVKDFGIGTYIRNLVSALAKIDRENRYTLVTYPVDSGQFSALPGNFSVVSYGRNDRDVLDHIAFPLFLKKLPADLYHLPLNVVPFWMPKPYMVTVHDVSRLIYDSTPGWRTDLRMYRIRRGLLQASRIIAVSGATRRDLQTILSVPGERIGLIYNGLDVRYLEHRAPSDARAGGPEARAHERRRILERYQANYPFLLYAGTIRPQKNIPRLVEAFAVLRGQLENHPVFSDLRLIIIGDEISRYPQVRRAVIQTRMENAVRFLGFVPIDTLRVFYESAEAFVFPSLYEGFGLPPLEAMACGTPVITSNVSSLPEVVGTAAQIVNPENVFDIARGMKEVLLDDQLRNRLRQAGYEQVKRFNWERTAREVLATYHSMNVKP